MHPGELTHRLRPLVQECPGYLEFRMAAEPLLRRAIGYDIVAWASIDPATLLFTSCDVFTWEGVGGNVPGAERVIFESEFGGDDPLTFTELMRSGRTVTRLRSEVEDLSGVHRYNALLEPAGAIDEMRILLSDRWGVWGAMMLYRTSSFPPFDGDDQRTAEEAAAVLSEQARHAFLQAAVGSPALYRPPGSLTLDADGNLAATSEPAEAWLDTLDPSQVTGAFRTLRHRLATETIARLMVVGNDGPVMLHAHHRKGGSSEVEVIVERPRPIEIADTIMAAHQLTPREAAVTRLLCQGQTNREIATGLELSPYTVADHLKSIFAKFDVASRSELLHRLYDLHYAPPRTRAATPSPYGYFLDPEGSDADLEV